MGTSSGTAQQSPFVIAFEAAGIKVLPSIINAALITSAFSCGLAVTFLASRVLYGLAEDSHAPRVFLRINRFGSPYVAVAASILLLPLVYLSLGSNSSVVFGWFVNIATVAALISWVVIEVTFLRFYYGLRAQGIDRDREFSRQDYIVVGRRLNPHQVWFTRVRSNHTWHGSLWSFSLSLSLPPATVSLYTDTGT